MQPRIVSKEEFKIVGMEVISADPKDFGDLWGRFLPRMGEITNQSRPCGAYGLCACGPECKPEEGICKCEEMGFSYTAGVEVSDFNSIPEGMVGKTVPAAKYAVFTHKGSLDKLGTTYDYIFQTWIKDSGYQITGPMFEYYDERFNPTSENSALDIYVPVK
jgi:AraC family transcriptional regulator